MDVPTPRVSSALLGQYVGQVVRISGKVISVSRGKKFPLTSVSIDRRKENLCKQYVYDTGTPKFPQKNQSRSSHTKQEKENDSDGGLLYLLLIESRLTTDIPFSGPKLTPELILESTDGGQVTVGEVSTCGTEITDVFVELVAKVESESRVKALDCSNLGDKYDLKLAQAVVDIIHNPNLRSERAPCF
ncbi:hypothetical protein PSTT_08031, partial [Puccinia striiformis]